MIERLTEIFFLVAAIGCAFYAASIAVLGVLLIIKVL